MRRDQNLDMTSGLGSPAPQKVLPMGGANEPEEPDEQKPEGGEYLYADPGEASSKTTGVGTPSNSAKPFRLRG